MSVNHSVDVNKRPWAPICEGRWQMKRERMCERMVDSEGKRDALQNYPVGVAVELLQNWVIQRTYRQESF